MTRGHPSPASTSRPRVDPALSWFLLEISQLANDQIGAFRLLPSSAVYTSCLWISVSPLARPPSLLLTRSLSLSLSLAPFLSCSPFLSISHSLFLPLSFFLSFCLFLSRTRPVSIARSPSLSFCMCMCLSLSLLLSNLRPPPSVHPVARSAGHVRVFISPTLRQRHDRPSGQRPSSPRDFTHPGPDQWSRTSQQLLSLVRNQVSSFHVLLDRWKWLLRSFQTWITRYCSSRLRIITNYILYISYVVHVIFIIMGSKFLYDYWKWTTLHLEKIEWYS